MTYSIKHKRGTTSQWLSSTYVLKDGELGIDKTLNKIKIGNGSSLWTALPYVNAVPSEISEMSQDAIWAAVDHNDHNHVSVTYDDVANKIIFSTEPEVVINSGLTDTLGDYLTVSEFNAQLDEIGGTPTLDESGLIRDSQIPAGITRDSELSSAISTEVSNRNTAISSAISTEVTSRNSAITTAVSNLVNSAPSTLDTLKELSDALGSDANFATTITTALGTKEPTLPLQTGNSGKFLTTDGTFKSWATVAQYTLPIQTSNSGKFLTTNGSVESWATIPVTSAATKNTLGTVYGFTELNNTSVALGYGTSTSADHTIAIGNQALNVNTTGTANVAVGSRALEANTTGQNNIAIGRFSLWQNIEGSASIAIGDNALFKSKFGANVVIGGSGLFNLTTGLSNTALGFAVGNSLTTGSENIIIGKSAEPSSATVSGEITLGTSQITRFRIPGLSVDWSASAYGRATYASTSAPSGGNDGDTWLVYTS
jgi:hypothetical protein